jgi:hypothetical protein
MKVKIYKIVLLILAFVIINIKYKVFSAWTDNPEVNLPICTVEGTQEHPRITTDSASGAIIVWQDMSSASSDIYAQRVDARGIVRWAKDGVAICLEKGEQWHPNLVSDGAGGAIIAWWDKRVGYGEMDIYTQRINGDGEIQWEPGGTPVCTAKGFQQELNIISDGEGGAIIAWHDYRPDSDPPDIYLQRINIEGRPLWKLDGIPVCKNVSYQSYPTLANDGKGGAIVAWHDWRDGDGDIYAQRINAGGELLWEVNGVLICRPNYKQHQWYPETISDGAGGAIIVWMDYRSKNGWDIYAQLIDIEGKIRWQKNGVPVCIVDGDQYDYSILEDNTGGVFITWCDQREGQWDIYAQRLDASGNALWAENGIPVCNERNDQYNPNIVSDGVDGVIISWWDKRDVYADIYAQRINANGEFLWVKNGAAICLAEGNQQDPHPINSGVGSAIITWWDKRKVDADIYAQRVFSE